MTTKIPYEYKLVSHKTIPCGMITVTPTKEMLVIHRRIALDKDKYDKANKRGKYKMLDVPRKTKFQIELIRERSDKERETKRSKHVFVDGVKTLLIDFRDTLGISENYFRATASEYSEFEINGYNVINIYKKPSGYTTKKLITKTRGGKHTIEYVKPISKEDSYNTVVISAEIDGAIMEIEKMIEVIDMKKKYYHHIKAGWEELIINDHHIRNIHVPRGRKNIITLTDKNGTVLLSKGSFVEAAKLLKISRAWCHDLVRSGVNEHDGVKIECVRNYLNE
jgi:hypothetical protein